MYRIIEEKKEKKKVAVGLFKQVLHEKNITWNFLECIWKQLEGSQRRALPQTLGHPVVSWD